MLTRREFIGAAIGATASAHAFALPADRFRWSINTNMFTPLKPHPETGFKMAARFGFHGVEPWANQMQKHLAQPPEVFSEVLERVWSELKPVVQLIAAAAPADGCDDGSCAIPGLGATLT